MECSAKDAINIPEVFRTLVAEMLNEPNILNEADKLVSGFRIKEEMRKQGFLKRIDYACC